MRRLVLVLASTAAGFLLLEVLLRAWFAIAPIPAESPYVPDVHAGYRLRPDTDDVKRARPDDYINSFGYRDVDHPVHKPPRAWRVLGLGDSFVYGAVAPRDNFLRVAQARLDAAMAADSLRAEMVMMGIGAYSTQNELGVLRSIGLELQPDAVVLCFFVGNDVTGIPLRGKVLGGQLYFTGAVPRLHDFLRHWYAYTVTEMFLTMQVKWPVQKALAARRSRAALATTPAAGTAVAPAADTPPIPPLNSVFLEFQRRRMPVYERDPGRRVAGLWRQAEHALADFDSTCKSAGIPWLLLAIPEEIQVDPDVRAAVLRHLGEPEARYEWELPQRRLRRFATARGVPLLDPLPRLQAEHRADARLYIPNDTHWNERGNRIAGELLSDALLAMRTRR